MDDGSEVRFTRDDGAERARLEELGYSIDRKLGEGGFGKVYLVRSLTGEERAAKVFSPLPEADRDRARTRFLRGARIAERIHDPRVVRTYAIYEGETPVIEMEFLPDKSLHELARAGTASAADLIAILAQTARTLHAVHNGHLASQETVHRDVKPLNILLRGGAPVLVDFDLAYAGGTDATGMTMQEGTRESRVFAAGKFMHPEFRSWFQNGALDNPETRMRFRSPSLDYYGICASLFFILTGQIPENRKLCERTIGERQQVLQAGLSTDQVQTIGALVLEGLADTLDEMPSDMGSLAEKLAACIKNESVGFRRLGPIGGLLWGKNLANRYAFQAQYASPWTARAALATLTLTILPIAAAVAWFRLVGGPGATITLWTLSGLLRGIFGWALSRRANDPKLLVLQSTTQLMHHLRHVATVVTTVAFLVVLVSTGAITFGTARQVPGMTASERQNLHVLFSASLQTNPNVKQPSERIKLPNQSATESSAVPRPSALSQDSVRPADAEPTTTELRTRLWQEKTLSTSGPADPKPRQAKIERSKSGGWQIVLPEFVCKVEFNSLTGNPSRLFGCQSRGATQLRYPAFDVLCSDSKPSFVVCTQTVTWIKSGISFPKANDWSKGTLYLRLETTA